MNLYTYGVKVTSVYDGDTVTADIDLGFGVWLHGQKLRLVGIDTPEIRGGTPETKLAARKSRDFVRHYLLGDDEVRIESQGKGKYGRWLARIYVKEQSDSAAWYCLNDRLIERGLAEPYGKKKTNIPAC